MDKEKFETISQAIGILMEESKKVNVNRVRDLTGLPSALIAKHPEMRPYLNPHKPKAAPHAPVEPSDVGEFLESHIDSYAAFLQSNYFDKPQTYEEVRWDLVAAVRNLNDELYKQAFSKLVYERILIKQGHTERYQKAPANTGHALIEVQGAGDFSRVPEAELDAQIAHLLRSHPGKSINIYRLSEVAAAEIRVVRTKTH